jgi:ATP-dependent RNA helicase RhlE
MTSFDALGVGAPILRALEHIGFDKPTEIQAAAIPSLMNGDDLIGVAQTGGGKTAAFVIPMLERLAGHADKPKPGMPRALILAPTRELAIQITDKIQELSVGTNAKCCTVYGGAPYKTQIHILRRGVDILVATPGRLKDHMKRGNIYLDEVEYFVLDEADRMLDMGFVDEVRDISKKLPVGHQSVMFSATMNHKISGLAATLLNDAVRIEVARQATIADNLEHKVMFVPGHKKNDLLLDMIERENPSKVLVFVRTRRDADRICDFLCDEGFKADAIHGDKKQNVRQRMINNFKADKFDFLVATDVAARGIDVTDISHVFNLDVPVEAESYVHRIGRTARGGASGKAFTFCGKNEVRLLRDIESLIKMSIEIDEDHAHPLPASARSGNGGGGRGFGGRGNGRGFGRGRDGGRSAGGRDGARGADRGDSRRPYGDKRGPAKGGNAKPWEKRANKRARADAEGGDNVTPIRSDKPWEQRGEGRSDDRRDNRRDDRREERQARSHKRPETRTENISERKPFKKRDDAKADTGERKTYRKREEGPAARKDGKKTWSKPAEFGAKPAAKKASGKKTEKRVDPSANKRKSKAGAKAAKKRPAVAARKAKAAQAKAFRKPSGGNAPLQRKRG